MKARSDQLEFGADVDGAGDASRHRAEAGMKPVDALRLGATLLRDREAIDDADPLDDQDAVLVLDVSDRLDLVALRIDLDLTRLQRAGERAGQSPTGRGDDIVERRRVGRILLGSNAVMLRDLRMDTEGHRLLLGG